MRPMPGQPAGLHPAMRRYLLSAVVPGSLPWGGLGEPARPNLAVKDGGLQPMSACGGFDSRHRISGPDTTSKESDSSQSGAVRSEVADAGPRRDLSERR